jgi:hypothetical protein
MKTKLGLTGAVCGALALALAQGAQAAAPKLGIDFSGGATDDGASAWNLGWSFTAKRDLTVIGLGNLHIAPFAQDQQVGLWDDDFDLLASAFVSDSGADVGQAPWRFTPITPVHLDKGRTFIVGGQGGADYAGPVQSVTLDPRITYGTDLFTTTFAANDPLAEPETSDGVTYGWFGGNVQFAAGVPEPTSWAMMLIGFGALGATLRRRRETVAA